MTRLAILDGLTAWRIGDARLGGNWQAIEAASHQLGIQLVPTLEIRKPEELDGALALAVRERAGGVLVLASPFFSSHGPRIAGFPSRLRRGSDGHFEYYAVATNMLLGLPALFVSVLGVSLGSMVATSCGSLRTRAFSSGTIGFNVLWQPKLLFDRG